MWCGAIEYKIKRFDLKYEDWIQESEHVQVHQMI